MDISDPVYKDLQDFANKHKLVLEDHGEVGFGRSCVGFEKGDRYVDFNPNSFPLYNPIEGFQDNRLHAPKDVKDAYHKHDCLCVLVRDDNYDEALEQLHRWVKHLESLGTVEVVGYPTGSVGLQAIVSGLRGYAVRIRD